MDIGLPELLIILVIIVLIFGPQRLSSLAGELGRGIHDFREGLAGKDKEATKPDSSSQPPDKRTD